MNILEYAETVIATSNIELIEALFQLSLALKVGVTIRSRIEAEVQHLNPYKTKVNSFHELVRLHEHETSPLQKLVASNGWLVLQDNSRLPWSFNEFLQLFRKTQFRGLRILPSLVDGKANFDEDTDGGKIENRRFALVREGESRDAFRIVFYEKEYFVAGREDDSARASTFSESKDVVHLTYDNYQAELQKKLVVGNASWTWKEVSFPALEIIERFFGGDSIPDDSLIFLDDFRWDLLLDSYYQFEKDLLVFHPLSDDGELQLDAELDGDGQIESVSFFHFVILNKGGHICLNEWQLTEYLRPYPSGLIWTENISGLDPREFPNLTREEQYSFYSYALKDRNVPGGLEFEGMEDVRYGCVDLDTGLISLIANKKLESNKQFRVLNTYRRGSLFFYSIEM